MSREEAVLDMERKRLDQWSAGKVTEYAASSAEDVSYFDDIAAHERVDGLAALLGYFGELEGQVPAHDYEIVDPRVQIYGDVAIVTLRYHASLNGEPMPPWKATSVHRFDEGEWKMVHAHWSLAKDN